MNEHRRQILQMLSDGKINADEAERLITAMEQPMPSSSSADSGSTATVRPRPRYLRVVVDSQDDGGH